MHPLHEYIATRVAHQVKSARVVVWYDPRSEFQPFVNELRGGARSGAEPVSVELGSQSTQLLEFAGSMFELRLAAEPLVGGDAPAMLVVYLPGEKRDPKASVLMELEKAGRNWEPGLKRLARNLLEQRYTQGVVDEMLRHERSVTYEDLARLTSSSGGSEPPSILRSIFHDASGSDGLLAAWLSNDDRDEQIAEKQAESELLKLIQSRLGLEPASDSPLAKLRAVTLRYVLASEFRLDLACEPPSSLDGVPSPPNRDAEAAIRALAERLRNNHAETYSALADRVEEELGLAKGPLAPEALGSIDTFRFEERALLRHAGELVTGRKFDDALRLVTERERSFWLDRDLERKAQWEALRKMAELGREAELVGKAVRKFAGDAGAWLTAYVGSDGRAGWFRVDQAQRRLEAWVTTLQDEPEEQPLGVVRRIHEDTCHKMAEGFTRALNDSGWTVPNVLHQARIWSEVVANQPKPVAYFLVDAMRFEMGLELAERLPKTSEVSVRPALGSLPSITPIGMAALMPGASSSFSVTEAKGKLGAQIDDRFLPDLAARKKHISSKVPELVDLALDELLGLQPSKLKKKLEGAQVIVVRSQEIDHAGETGFTFQARQVMNTVIDNLARAVRKLSAAGVEHAVISADHGHLFFADDRDESMRCEAPGGSTVELHRRCWIGRGGSTPKGAVRVSAASLGYASDLDFVFPRSTGVFKSGGDLAFHHGGPSLQELIVPVITVRTQSRQSARPSAGPISVASLPPAVTNRIITVTLTFGEKQLSFDTPRIQVRPLLMSSGKQVGALGMAVDAPFDTTTGCVTLEPNKPVTVALLLADDAASSVRVVVQDPSSDAELYRSPSDLPVRILT